MEAWGIIEWVALGTAVTWGLRLLWVASKIYHAVRDGLAEVASLKEGHLQLSAGHQQLSGRVYETSLRVDRIEQELDLDV